MKSATNLWISKFIILASLTIPLISNAQNQNSDKTVTFRVVSKLTPYAARIHITGVVKDINENIKSQLEEEGK